MTVDHTTRGDAELVAAVRAGREDAFAELLRRHRPSVERLCRRIAGSRADGQDVAQEAFVQAFVGLERLRRPEAFGSWVHAIAANLAVKSLRAPRHASLDGDLGARGDTLEAVAAREALTAALAELSAEQRDAIVAHLAGYSYDEIARRAGVPLSTVRGRVFQSRLRLRAALTEREEHRPMEPIRVRPAVYGTFRRSTDRVLVLAEDGGTRELPVRLSAADAAAVEAALARSELPQDAPHELSLRLLRALGGRVEQAAVDDAGGAGYSATLTVAAGETRRDVRAEVAAALALAAADDAPVVVAADVFRRRSCDPTDVATHRRHDRHAQRELRRRLDSGELPEPVPPPELDVDVGPVLDRLAAAPGVRTVVLRHESGALQAWRGTGDPHVLAVYAASADGDDDELAELVTHVAYPSEHVLAGVRFDRVAREWQLEAALVAEEEETERAFVATRDKLESLLRPAGTSGGREP